MLPRTVGSSVYPPTVLLPTSLVRKRINFIGHFVGGVYREKESRECRKPNNKEYPHRVSVEHYDTSRLLAFLTVGNTD